MGDVMDQDNVQTAVNRFYTLLHWQLAAQLPRPGGVHKYSHGGLITGFVSKKVDGGWIISISEGINYGAYAMGYNAIGEKRTPRGPLEAMNFQIIEKAIKGVSRVVALPSGGKVVIEI